MSSLFDPTPLPPPRAELSADVDVNDWLETKGLPAALDLMERYMRDDNIEIPAAKINMAKAIFMSALKKKPKDPNNAGLADLFAKMDAGDYTLEN
jgi:hypothetical protein